MSRLQVSGETMTGSEQVLIEDNAISEGGRIKVGRPGRWIHIRRNVLSNILRGRIEDLAGWALFVGGDAQEAVVRLRRAVSVLPETSSRPTLLPSRTNSLSSSTSPPKQ